MLGPVNSFVISDIRYKRIIINAFSALGGNLHFVISDLVITGVYCVYVYIYFLQMIFAEKIIGIK